jgi:hypothetical protein
MKIKLLFILNFLFVGLASSQVAKTETKEIIKYDTVHITKTVTVYDTIFDFRTSSISYDTINNVLLQSDYNKLYEQLLDQKQKHYDSSLSALQWVSGILAAIITLGAIVFGFLGYNSIEKIRKRLREDFDSEKIEIEKRIKSEANKIVSNKYEREISELKEKVLNFERYAEDASNSFTVKRGKEKPELRQRIETPSRNTNPFDKKNK